MIISVGSIVKLGIRPETRALDLSGVLVTDEIHRFQRLEMHQKGGGQRSPPALAKVMPKLPVTGDESTSVKSRLCKTLLHSMSSQKVGKPFLSGYLAGTQVPNAGRIALQVQRHRRLCPTLPLLNHKLT